MVIGPEVRSALAEHADAEDPHECCGLIALRNDVAERYVRGRNLAASPYRFELEVDPVLWMDLWDEGYEIAIFHSHPSSPPNPSRTDIENIGQWEGHPYVIFDARTRDLAAWRIADGRVERLELSDR